MTALASNKKNEHSIELFENTKFMLPGVPVPHFNEVVKPALDAGLASVSPFQGPPCFPERKEIVQVVWDREQTLLVHLQPLTNCRKS